MDSPPLLLKPRTKILGPLAIAAGAASAAAVVFLFDPAEYGFYPICYLHFFTGLNCPGCGSMRALHAILHGNIREAARLNSLFLGCLPFAVWSVGRQVAGYLGGQRADFSIRPVWLWTLLIVATAFTVIRNHPGFEWLAP